MYSILGLLTAISFVFILIQGFSKLLNVDLQKFVGIKLKTINTFAVAIIFISFLVNLILPPLTNHNFFNTQTNKEVVTNTNKSVNTTIKVDNTFQEQEVETIKTTVVELIEDEYQILDYDLSTMQQNIELLVIDNNSEYVTGYNRDEFGDWIDEDKDCQNTRAEILIDTSKENVSFKEFDNCVVSFGYWYDPYTDEIFKDASDLDIDHFVPLKNAYVSGAYLWSEDKKKEYSNFRGNEYHLIPVFKSANREKSAFGPEVWLPENENFHCKYISIWVEIKVYWGLTVNEKEYKKILEIVDSC